MKKVRFLALAMVFVLLMPLMNSCKKKFVYDVEYVETEFAGTTLNVHNWGEYIADGSEEYQDIIKLFEKKYDIKVNYTTYASNEDLYATLKTGASSYDIVIPSDYMIGKLIQDNLLQKIDVSKLSNYHYIDDQYKNLFFDPANEYSVPYTVGMIGVIYNTKVVDEADAAKQSWDLMWNEKYKGNILTYDNARDAFGIAQLRAGMDVNSENEADWDAAYQSLLAQRPYLQGFVMDEVFQTMEGGNAAIASYYAGDCISMIAENPDLAFYYPVEGTNIFVDSMCVPANAKNVGAAMLFMDFMLEPDIAAFNSNYICYASPNTAVLTNEYYDFKEGTDEYNILYVTPDSYRTDASKMQYYHTLSEKTIQRYNDLFLQVKDKK